MELGIIGSPTEESFQSAANKGLQFLEFCINIGANTEAFFADLEHVKKWSQQYGVRVASIGRWGTDRIAADGSAIEDELKITYQLIDAAAFLGCDNFVCGCNYVESLSYYANCTAAIGFYEKLIEYGRAKGVTISAYNCSWNNFVDNEMAWSVIHGHLKELGIKFDPSHSRYAGRDYLQEAVDWGHRFRHIHIKGSLIVNGKRVDDPPAGLDQTDWGSFMAILYDKGYDGGLSIEPHSHTWSGELGSKGIDYTIQFMNRLLFQV